MIVYRTTIDLNPIEDLNINMDTFFEYDNAIIYTQNSSLIIILKCDIKPYEGIVEVAKYCRPTLLKILSLITFFVGYPLTIYNVSSNEMNVKTSKKSLRPFNRKVHLKINNKSHTANLKKILYKINKPDYFASTILNRWQKALFLTFESNDADLYYDEALLTYFHIFEQFAENVYEKIDKNINNNTNDIKNELQKLYEKLYLYDKRKSKIEAIDTHITTLAEKHARIIKTDLHSEILDKLATRIKYTLHEYNLLDDIVENFIELMIKKRNDVAHGRKIDSYMCIWPLSPFFNISKDPYEYVNILKYLTATLISKYFGITTWLEEWKEIRFCLPPTKKAMENLVKNKIDSLNLDSNNMVTGNTYNLTFRNIFYYLLNHNSEIEKTSIALKNIFLSTKLNKNNYFDIYNISVLFLKSPDQELKTHALNNIQLTLQKKWIAHSEQKDLQTLLKGYNINIKEYEDYLIKG